MLRAIIVMLVFVTAAVAQGQNAVDVKPSPQQVAWQDLEFGVLIHFGPNTFMDREWGDGTASPEVFNPTDFNADQWMSAIKAAGAKYVVMVAKHHDGFCLWPTRQTDYSVKSSPWKGPNPNVDENPRPAQNQGRPGHPENPRPAQNRGRPGHPEPDVIREVSEAARRAGLKFGVYLSPWDRHDPRYKNSAEYDTLYIRELEELRDHYGELVEFWLDGAGSEGHVYDFRRIIEELRVSQPNTLVFADAALFEYGDIRWAGNEDGVIPYENWNVLDRHGYLRWRPVEADTPLHKGHWFWHPNDDATLKSVSELVSVYEQSVGNGGQLMLGLAPDRRGLLPEKDVERLKEFGEAIRARYGENLALNPPKPESRLSGAPDLEVDFGRPVTFDHALIMEWLNEGQKIEKYRVEAWDGSKWNAVVEGQAIGHKRILSFAPVTASKVRLNIVSAAGTARVREFQVFNVGGQKSKGMSD